MIELKYLLFYVTLCALFETQQKWTGSTPCLKVGEGTGASSGPRLSSGSRSGGNSVSSRRLKLKKKTPQMTTYQRI